MSDAFADLIDQSNRFFAQLAQNNEKSWYEAHKAQYVDEVKKPAELLADFLAQDFSKLCGRAYQAKLFRIHRDVRFSKDKTPYNAHLHLMWRPGDAACAPSWFLGAAPDYLIMGCGLMQFEKQDLDRFRARIDSHGAQLAEVLQDIEQGIGAAVSDFGPAPLKRVPKPYSPDHPQAALLKRKNLVISAPFPDDWRGKGGIRSALDLAAAMLPAWEWMDALS